MSMIQSSCVRKFEEWSSAKPTNYTAVMWSVKCAGRPNTDCFQLAKNIHYSRKSEHVLSGRIDKRHGTPTCF